MFGAGQERRTAEKDGATHRCPTERNSGDPGHGMGQRSIACTFPAYGLYLFIQQAILGVETVKKDSSKEDKKMRRKMQKMKGMFVALGLCAVLAAVSVGTVKAGDAGVNETTAGMQDAEYDLEKGGTQSFEILDADGEETEIVVEEVPGIARVAKGTYKITGKNNRWTAGFYVDISGNRIVKAHDRFYKTMYGKISGAKLIKNSDAQVTLSFTYEGGKRNEKTGVTAKIINKKLVTGKL